MQINDITPKTEKLPIRIEKNLVLQGNPLEQVEFARKASKALVDVIESKVKKVIIGGETYIEFEDWMMIGRFYGASVGVEWTKPVMKGDKVWGYEARANVLMNGQIVSSAEAMCTKDERNWEKRDEFMVRSMAQTRASAKALRNVFAWVVTMAGYRPTPAEEMDGLRPQEIPVVQLEPKRMPEASTKAVQEEIYKLCCKIFMLRELTPDDFKHKVKSLTDLEYS